MVVTQIHQPSYRITWVPILQPPCKTSGGQQFKHISLWEANYNMVSEVLAICGIYIICIIDCHPSLLPNYYCYGALTQKILGMSW